MAPPIARQDFDAVLFDLDGVLTTTRVVHAAAWKRTFDEFLADWDARHETSSEPFDDHADYAAHVDGKARPHRTRRPEPPRASAAKPGPCHLQWPRRSAGRAIVGA